MVRLIERISHLAGVIAGWLIVPLVFAAVYEVIARYAFNAPTIWAYEIGYLMTGSGFLLGMAYALSRDAHIRIDVLSTNMSQRTKAVIDIACYVGLLIPFIVWLLTVLWRRAHEAMLSGEKSGQSAWNPVVWPFRTVFVVAFVLLLIQVVAEVIKAAQRLRGADTGAR
jgi:TRAP-type mannitol/chloroaromatic compound transport system permease small subunit